MPLNLVLYLVFSVLDLLKGTIICSIPTFAFVLIITFVRRKIEAKYKFSWIKSVLASSFVVLFASVLLIYFLPVALSLGQENIGEVPPVESSSILETLGLLVLLVARLLIVVVILVLMLLPLEFVAVYLFERISKVGKLNYYIRLYLVSFLITLIALVIVLFVFPWLLTGTLYMVFYGV